MIPRTSNHCKPMKTEPTPHLDLPTYATSRHRFPKWNIRVDVTQEPRLLRRLMPGIQPEIAIIYRDRALANSRECRMRAARARKEAATLYGNAGGLNPYPVSGGTCEHWPRDVAGYVWNLACLVASWDSIARAWHAYAGKRPATFPRNHSGLSSAA